MSLRYRKKAFAGRVDDRDTTAASIFAALANLKRPAITLCAVVVVVNEFARLSITILGTYRLPRAGLRTLVNALLGSSVGLNALVVLTSLVVQLLKMEPRQRPILRRSTFGLAYFEKRVTVVVLRASGFDHQLDAIVATLCGAAQAFNLNDFFEECDGDSTPHECVVAYVEERARWRGRCSRSSGSRTRPACTTTRRSSTAASSSAPSAAPPGMRTRRGRSPRSRAHRRRLSGGRR